MNWVEMDIYTTTEGIEAVTGSLLGMGINGFVIKDAKDFQDFLDDKDGNWDYIDDDLMGLKNCETTVTVYLPENAQGLENLEAMKLELWCDGVDFLKKTGRLYASAKGGRCYNITSIRPQGQMALLQLEGVNDMDAARALRGQVFYFDRSDATLPEGRWYVADLIGCEVRDADTGKVYGVVTSVDHPGAQDIYTVKSPSGREYMFPGVDAFLKERNPPEGYILVTPIPGLLDDDFDSEREEE